MVAQHGFRQLASLDDTQTYLTYLMIDKLHFLTLNYETGSGSEKCEVLGKYVGRGAHLRSVVYDLQEFTQSILAVRHPGPQAT